ncbi:MAG: hypothetical protein HYW71_00585 [Candidatus Niyogibacteria bacterium]|nr:hypothetical protein [Candidatus Niyogibacteria bacterium]
MKIFKKRQNKFLTEITKRITKKAILRLAVGVVLSAGFFVLFPNLFFKINLEYIRTKDKNAMAVQEETVKKIIHLQTPEPVKAIYMTSWVAGTSDWRDRLVEFIEKSELNAVVIDIKDYTGRISFEVVDPALMAVGSQEKRIPDIREFIGNLHEKNIYAIARISVFQDIFLVKKRPDLAVKTKTGAVWKDYKGISWLDPCAKEVWDYTVKIAREAEQAGFDELNFDYIRFPSDGNMANIVYSFCRSGAGLPSKAERLEEFFKYLSDNLKDMGRSLSADLFGMVTVNADDLNIGQVLEKAAPYFNYLAPMVYPSHYPKGFNNYQNPAAHPYEIVYQAMAEASRRLIAASSTPKKLRPWIQDFDLGAEYTAEMVNLQKKAVYDAGLTGWMAWDAGNKYTKEAY